MDSVSLHLEKLPWPTSVNSSYRTTGSRVHLSRKSRAFRGVCAGCLRQGMGEQKVDQFTGDVSVLLGFHPPDKRKRDMDNLFKIVFDALEFAGVIEDDSQIKHLQATLSRPDPDKQGHFWITVFPLVSHDLDEETEDDRRQ